MTAALVKVLDGMPVDSMPDGWQLLKLGAFAYVTKLAGFEYTKYFDYSQNGPVIAVRGLNVRDGTLDLTDVHTIPQETSDLLPRSKLAKGDLVISYVGTLGRVAVIPENGRFHLAPNVAKISVDSSAVCPEYLSHYLNSFAGQKVIFEAAASTTQAALSMRNLREILILLPPSSEQRAIAAALSDADALIHALDKLIVKKHAIKLATMQELLTGKTRLPGFTAEWQTKLLGDVANIKTGKRNNEDKTDDGEYPFFVRSEHIERINSYAYDCEAILVPGEGRIGEIFHHVNGRFDVHQRVYAITRFDETVYAKFVYFYLAMHFGKWAMQNTVKATVDSLRLPTFQSFEMLIPPERKEQTCISEVLSDMDAEIAALQRRRDKTKEIKQGMMQALLTGRVRLVQPEAVGA